ncbi:MAG: hypothetical protein ABEN55_11795, partial [Bradymonadaceae bacterium]
IVHAGHSEGGESFDITVDQAYETRCTDAANYCSDGQTAHLCDFDGGGFTEVSCDAGCQPSTGRCRPPDGDVCESAPSVSSSDATLTRTVDLLQHRDDYALGAESCLETDNPRTGGPDRTFQVELEARQSVTVTAAFANEAEGAIYLAETCDDAGTSCVTGAQRSTETATREVLRYSNLTENSQTRTLVVDTAAGQRIGDVDVEFEFTEVVCDPGSKTCNQNG